jgi:hypothetical protein
VAESLQCAFEMFLEVKSGVIRADRDSHGDNCTMSV